MQPPIGGYGAGVAMNHRLDHPSLPVALGKDQAEVGEELGTVARRADRLALPARNLSVPNLQSHDSIGETRVEDNSALAPSGDGGVSHVRLDAALIVFDSLALAVIMFDRASQVVAVSRAATRILDDNLRIVGRRLWSSSRSATAQFERALHQVTRSTTPTPALVGANSPASLFMFPRLHGRPVAACLSRLDALGSSVVAMATFTDLNRRSSCLDVALARSFGLSPGEAHLAVALCSGHALPAAADLLGITYETARSRLKIVLAKTGTRRQAELVALLIHAAWVLPAGLRFVLPA